MLLLVVVILEEEEGSSSMNKDERSVRLLEPTPVVVSKSVLLLLVSGFRILLIASFCLAFLGVEQARVEFSNSPW